MEFCSNLYIYGYLNEWGDAPPAPSVAVARGGAYCFSAGNGSCTGGDHGQAAEPMVVAAASRLRNAAGGWRHIAHHFICQLSALTEAWIANVHRAGPGTRSGTENSLCRVS